MTEQEARKRLADTVSDWVGGKRGGREHLEILNIYNSHKPLPRGYAVKHSDAYCATTVSAATIKAGMDKYIPVECSCAELTKQAKQLGIWHEADDYIPDVGDIILYDWQDTGVGDNTGAPDHVGIVTEVRGYNMASKAYEFTVTEGNIGGAIGTRKWYVNRPCTRGYITPDYKAIAMALTVAENNAKNDGPAPEARQEEKEEAMAEGRIHKLSDAPTWAQPELKKLIERGALKGGTTGDLDLSEDMLRVLIVCQRMVDGK